MQIDFVVKVKLLGAIKMTSLTHWQGLSTYIKAT